ncbi:hypothetical protein B9Z19DRAFT_1160231 [Tuber borchii]|uniref:Uncharacterized protein n=1 Tax=Tuber borchii TaxID=42251 RepID=A0A2T6ZF59_TUBBO|nr:hypothetical protein B9Z19DRAFT_1160231 [Tuber borchii]
MLTPLRIEYHLGPTHLFSLSLKVPLADNHYMTITRLYSSSVMVMVVLAAIPMSNSWRMQANSQIISYNGTSGKNFSDMTLAGKQAPQHNFPPSSNTPGEILWLHRSRWLSALPVQYKIGYIMIDNSQDQGPRCSRSPKGLVSLRDPDSFISNVRQLQTPTIEHELTCQTIGTYMTPPRHLLIPLYSKFGQVVQHDST